MLTPLDATGLANPLTHWRISHHSVHYDPPIRSVTRLPPTHSLVRFSTGQMTRATRSLHGPSVIFVTRVQKLTRPKENVGTVTNIVFGGFRLNGPVQQFATA